MERRINSIIATASRDLLAKAKYLKRIIRNRKSSNPHSGFVSVNIDGDDIFRIFTSDKFKIANVAQPVIFFEDYDGLMETTGGGEFIKACKKLNVRMEYWRVVKVKKGRYSYQFLIGLDHTKPFDGSPPKKEDLDLTSYM